MARRDKGYDIFEQPKWLAQCRYCSWATGYPTKREAIEDAKYHRDQCFYQPDRKNK